MIGIRVAAVVLGIAALPASAPTTALLGTVTAGGKAAPDAVVWLDVAHPVKAATRADAVLDQRNMQFYPHVLAVQVGTIVKFPNDDRVFHNVFSFHDGKKFNLGLYPVGAVQRVPFDRPGLSRVFCNIHPQMAAYVMVVDTPYFAVSDDAGRFEIRGLPVDTYVYHAWRPGASILTDSVVVEPGLTLDIRWR